MKKDYRSKDIERLSSVSIESIWNDFWESFMCNEISEIKDENQKDWHLSRISFLMGFIIAKKPNIANKDFDWVKKALKTIDLIYCKEV